MRNPTTCAARDPRTCRYHGTVLRMEQALAGNDADAYLIYKARVEDLETQPQPESFFNPKAEPEEIVSTKQLTNLINATADGPLSQTYFAKFEFNGNMLGIYGKRYRTYAKKQRLNFTNTKTATGAILTIQASEHRDLRHIRIMLEDGQHLEAEKDLQGAHMTALAASR